MKTSKQTRWGLFADMFGKRSARNPLVVRTRSNTLPRAALFVVLFVIPIFLVGSGLFGNQTADASTGIEQDLSFEGKIDTTSSGINITNGTYNMEFKIYSGGTATGGGTLVWTEDYLVSNSDGVAFNGGTFQVNLGQYCPFSGGACTPSSANDGNTNSGVNWDTYPLYLSVQVGSTSSCSPTSNNFQSVCSGDGEMSPYILMDSSPYAFNASELGGVASTGFVQTAPGSTQTVQPTANATGLIVEQNSGSTYGDDVFDVQGSGGSSDDFLQVTSSAANTGNVNIQALGSSSTVGIQTGTSGTISIGTTNANTIDVGAVSSTAVASTVKIATSSTSSHIQAVTIGSNGDTSNTITIDAGTGAGAIQIGTSSSSHGIEIGTGAGVETVTAGSTNSSSTTTVQGGTGGIGINTGAGSGATGSISIETGNSSGGVPGNVTIDTGTGVLSGTDVVDDTFEGTGSGSTDDFTDCDYGCTIAPSNTYAHSGSYSLKFSETGQYWAVYENYQDITVIPGDEYYVTAWFRGSNAETITGQVEWSAGGVTNLNTITDTSTGWTEMTGDIIAPAGATAASTLFASASGASGYATYLDDYVFENLSSVTTPYVNIGATNAEAVTLGNVDENGLTAIQGGTAGVLVTAGDNATIAIGSSANVNNINVGATGSSAVADEVDIADSTGAAQTVTAGSTDGTSTTTVQGGTGGIDLSDTTGTISIGATPLDGTVLGYSGVGSNGNGGSATDGTVATEVTTSASGTIGSASVYITSPTDGDQYQFALYSNNSGVPGNYLASSSIGTTTGSGGWYTQPFTYTLAASTTYWLVYWNNNADGINYNGSGGTVDNASYTWQTGADNGWPATYPSGTGYGVDASLYMSYTTGSATALSVNDLGVLTATGTANFESANNSTTAFQVQNSSGYSVLTGDTSNDQVVLGTASHLSGAIEFASSGGAGTVSLAALSTAPSTSFTLYLPTTAPTTGQCLQAGATTADDLIFGACASGGGSGINNQTTLQSSANFAIQSAGTSDVGGVIEGANGQTADLLDLKTYNGTTATTVDSFNDTGDLSVADNGLTSNHAVTISSTSAVQTSGSDLLNISDTATLTTSGGSDYANLVNVSRALTANISGGSSTAPSLDTSGTGPEFVENDADNPTFTTSYTVGSHSNRFLMVTLATQLACTGHSFTVTYDSASMTQIGTSALDSTGCEYFFGLVNPVDGSSQTLELSANIGIYSDMVVSSWYNVNQTTPYNTSGAGSFTTNTGTTSTASVAASSVSGQVVVDMLANMATATGNPSTTQSGQTSLAVGNDQTTSYELGGSYESAASGSTTNFGWSGLQEFAGVYDWDEDAIGLNGIVTPVSETVASPVASFSNSCTTEDGGASVCSDASNVLQIAQSYSGATGAVLAIQNSGTGDMLDLDNGSSTVLDSFSNTGSLTIGSGTPSVPALLTLGSGTGDPTTAVSGALYYNSSTGNFRCGVAGTWENCIGGLMSSSSPATAVHTCTTACGAIATGTSMLPANYCVAGRVIHITASGTYSSASTAPTLALSMYLGTNTAKASDTLLGAVATAATAGTSASNLGWSLNVYIYCVSSTSAWVQGGTLILTTTAGANALSQISATAATTITNTTQNLYIFPAWGTSSSSNTITCDEFIIQGM